LIIFMAAGLRKAKAAEFQIHPTAYCQGHLPERERLTAEVLQRHADALSKTDERAINLFVDRTGYTREFFEDEKRTEDLLSPDAAIESGLVHQMAGSTPPCDPAWPENMSRIEKETGCIFPSWAKTPAYFEACRCAAYFDPVRNEDHGTRLPMPEPSASSETVQDKHVARRLTVIAG
jgi:hypothetical protein